MERITEEEFNRALPVMQKLLWADQSDRERIQELGLSVIPANFYSNTPSVSEVLASYEYNEQDPPYLNCGIFDQSNLRTELSDLIPYSIDFSPSDNGDPETSTSFFWNNSQFSHSDAMSYFAYIRRIKPRTVLEIGSGFSSLIALEALQRNGSGKLLCVEPFPRPFIKLLSDEGKLQLNTSKAQEITATLLNSILQDGDILFIDSTHTIKTGSDCLHIYLRLIPQLRKKVYIHVHDIFLPFGLPQRWLIDHQIYWTEQYLLLALLIDNPRAKLLFGSKYHEIFNTDLLKQFMRGRARIEGGSFWFEYDGRSKM